MGRLYVPTLAALALALTLEAGCNDGGGLRKIGAGCLEDTQCESGFCGGGQCLDPEADNDGDSLINRIEGALGTNPLQVDSDGDGVDDQIEVGNVDAPTDSDGDGRIDAVESDTADADGDCIVDQLDPRDSFSDPASEAFPEACGDGTVRCEANPLVGSCAAPLGAMLVTCFHPSGTCSFTVGTSADGTGVITWSNGAKMSWKVAGNGAVAQLLGENGALCGTLRVADIHATDPVSTLQLASGPTFTIHSTDTATTLTCPGGTEVTLRDSDSTAFSQCSGAQSQSTCSVNVPGTCTTDRDCAAGNRCCPIPNQPDVGSYCKPVDTCPTGA